MVWDANYTLKAKHTEWYKTYVASIYMVVTIRYMESTVNFFRIRPCNEIMMTYSTLSYN